MSVDMLTILKWTARFPLRDVLLPGSRNPVPEGTRGIFMWGFDALDREILWYVGKSVNIRSQLRAHHGYLERGENQIPKGFLKGRFETLADVASDWKRDPNDPRMVEQLRDPNRMGEILRAGRDFANSAYARIARLGGKSETELEAIKKAVIYDLQPFINKRSKSTSHTLRVKHVLAVTESDWLEGWHVTHEMLVEQQII